MFRDFIANQGFDLTTGVPVVPYTGVDGKLTWLSWGRYTVPTIEETVLYLQSPLAFNIFLCRSFPRRIIIQVQRVGLRSDD